MNPNRKPFYPDLLIFIFCLCIACFLAGKWMAEESAAECVGVKVKKLSADMTKTQKRHWVNYYVNRGGS